MKQGLRAAVIYSLKPHQLGFCGPQNKKVKDILDSYLAGRYKKERKVREILKEFRAAFSYYKLIADSNKIKDPLSDKVVEAYWIGNSLLEKVKISDLKRMIVQKFKRPDLVSLVSRLSRPHHSFHVLVIGSITGRVILKGKLLDLCRIGYGQIIKVKRDKVVIRYRAIILRKRVKLGNYLKKEFDWDKNIITKLKVGDWVSFHWRQVCQLLNPERIKKLEYYTELSIKNANAEKK